jgi:hypothetical protein
LTNFLPVDLDPDTDVHLRRGVTPDILVEQAVKPLNHDDAVGRVNGVCGRDWIFLCVVELEVWHFASLGLFHQSIHEARVGLHVEGEGCPLPGSDGRTLGDGAVTTYSSVVGLLRVRE